MAVMKVIELMADSTVGWDDAAAKAVKRASKTVKNIQSAWVKDQSVTVKKGEIRAYRVVLKVTFAID